MLQIELFAFVGWTAAAVAVIPVARYDCRAYYSLFIVLIDLSPFPIVAGSAE
jgi:hypothetical protein